MRDKVTNREISDVKKSQLAVLPTEIKHMRNHTNEEMKCKIFMKL